MIRPTIEPILPMMLKNIYRLFITSDKKFRKCGLVSAGLIVFSAGCIPEPSGPTEEEYRGTIDFSHYEQAYDELPGSWDWIRTMHFDTIDGIPAIETPASLGIRKVLLITADQQIEIVQDDTISTTEPLESFLQNVEWGIRGDTLATKADNEGPETVYLRSEEDQESFTDP